MARATRRVTSEDDDEIHDKSVDQSNGASDQEDEDSIGVSRRKKRRINYNEDDFNSEIDEEDVDDPDADADEKKGDSHDNLQEPNDADGSSQRSRARKRAQDQDDDEYVSDNYEDDDPSLDEDDDLNSDSSFKSRPKRSNMSNFIVKDENDDDDDDDEDDEYSKAKLKRKMKSRSRRSNGFGRRRRRSGRRNAVRDDEDESQTNDDSDADVTKDSATNDAATKDELTLEQELQDLKDSSPINSPVTRNLRERKQINYTLPPPITNDNQLDAADMETSHPSTPHRRNGTGMGRGRYSNYYGGSASGLGTGLYGSGGSSFNQPIRRLFPTVGPFGGGDVQSIFQKGLANANNLTALGNADDSSDSDDDELFKPTDPNDTASKIITAASMDPSNPLHKKKNTLADTDPLGIDTNIDFSAVGGLDNYINQLKEMITLPLLYPEIYSQFHITPPRGVLFHGPPGTGKTLMARALAASCSSEGQKITFFMRKGADCLSKWVGEAERHLRLLFEEAKTQQPAIIFFDEIDGLAPVRSSKQEQIHASIVSTLLALMDGMDNRGQVIVIGATNRPDSIDPALRRPGRFDREFYFPLPDKKARKEILEIQMRKWKNKPSEDFVQELARLTKGYGGADLRALCTESALNSIQRSFPQIYKSNDKLKLDLSKIEVQASDFMRAVGKIIPSSARATSTQSSPLSETIKPLLNRNLQSIVEKLDKLVPNEKQPTILEESEYLDVNALIHPEDGGFKHYQLLSRLGSTRCYRPRLVISGTKGSGQTYISKAVLHHLESFHIQVLDFSKIYNEAAMSPEACLIQIFSELKRHKPSVLYIPDALNFIANVSPSFRSTMYGLIKSIDANDRILLMAMVEDSLLFENDPVTRQDLLDILDIEDNDIFELSKANEGERTKFFKNVWEAIALNPLEFGDLSVRPKRKLRKLPIVKTAAAVSKENGNGNQSDKEKAKKEKELLKQDMSLKNTLKIRLSALMDLFKVRYKRFKKPAVDDAYLVHLFESFPDPDALYQRDQTDDMIVEVSTGKKFYNIDLEVIEERLWNGFYSEPQQFLKDIEMILKDAKTVGERERLLKANEMYANAQVGIEEIEMAFPGLVEQWKDVRKREKQREKEYLDLLEQQKLKDPASAEITGEPQPEAMESIVSTNSAADVENMIDQQDSEDKMDVENKEAALTTDILNDGQEQAQSQLQVGNIGAVAQDTMLPVEPISLAKAEESSELSAEEVAKKEQVEEEAEKEEEKEEEEEEEEEEIEMPEIPTLIIDKSTLKGLKKKLIEVTADKTVDELERIDSKLIETIWHHRLEVDKSRLLEALHDYISSI